MIYPTLDDLQQQLSWYRKRLKPYIERNTIGFWAENPDKYQFAIATEAWLIKAIQASKDNK